MALERELETYNAHLPSLSEHEGKYAVIQGDQVAGIWKTYEDALKAGYDQFGLTTFMVKQIFMIEPIHHL